MNTEDTEALGIQS